MVKNKEKIWRKMNFEREHCRKSFSIFPSPAGMSLSLGGNYDNIYKLFLVL
jgi:hypothetical protein